MQIQIRPILNEEGIKEWAIIELQGSLESKYPESFNGKFIGDVHYKNDGTPFLFIAHHLIYGEVEKLYKPFAVLKKSISETGKTEYLVIGLIKRRLIFSERPMPILTFENVHIIIEKNAKLMERQKYNIMQKKK